MHQTYILDLPESEVIVKVCVHSAVNEDWFDQKC